MSEIIKSICPGFNLKIKKRLSEYLIDFIVENTTDFVFLFTLTIKSPIQVQPVDGELEKNVQVFPSSVFSLMQLRIEGSFNYGYSYKYQKLSMEPIEKSVKVAEDLILTITQVDLERKIEFELANNASSRVHFELTLIELSGIKSIDGKSLFVVDLDPYSKGFVCELQFEGVWSYKYSFASSFDDETLNPPL